MKKSILFVAAMIAACTMNAAVFTIDLNSGASVEDESPATFAVADGVMTVNWNVTVDWGVSGVDFDVTHLTNISKFEFEYMGDGSAIVLYPYLLDEEWSHWTQGELWPSLSETSWTSLEITPNAKLWENPDYNYGEKAIIRLGFVANPATAQTGVFKLRNIKITADEATNVENVAVKEASVKVMRDGQMYIIRDGKTFNALGAEVK